MRSDDRKARRREAGAGSGPLRPEPPPGHRLVTRGGTTASCRCGWSTQAATRTEAVVRFQRHLAAARRSGSAPPLRLHT